MVTGKSDRLYRNICAFIATFVAAVCLYPLLYTVFVSLCSSQEWIDKGGVLWFFPGSPTFVAYEKIFGSTTVILRAIGVSALRTVLGTLLGLLVNAVAAFVLSRKDLPGKKVFMVIMLFTVLFSGGLIPTYLTVEALGLKNTIWSMIIPALFNGWNILIFKQFFEGIPKELEDMARIDGVSEAGLFVHIVFPMSKAVFAAIGLFTLVGHWNSWFDASIYLDASHQYLWPLQLYTKVNLENTAGLSQGGLDFLINNNTSVKNITMQMALTVVTVLPLLCIYPFFQNSFTKGVYLGAIKG